MKKAAAIILCLLLLICNLGGSAEELELGERKVGVDIPAGWYSIYLEKSGFGATHVYLPEGCVLDLPETVLLFPLVGEIPVPDVAFDENGLCEVQSENASSDRLLYEDDYLSISFSSLRVEKLGDSSYLMTEYLFVNKTDELLDVTCDSIIVNGCAVDISKFVEIPGNSKYLYEWTNDAEMYLKYGITDVASFSMIFDYRGGENVSGVRNERTSTIQLK
ncbi:MAG: hypothetical protein PHI98_16620 [Eubacteriales bacterium]|nr:hypothetical protein [Eubacteriales bacterium]